MKAPLHGKILDMLKSRYDRPIMNNVYRGDYVECMIASVLGAEWRLTWTDGWDWAAWDCEHIPTGVRLEIKQAAARQSWDGERSPDRRNPFFDIAHRKGYWTRVGEWVDSPGRPADLFIFAWHGRRDRHTDHRDPDQWCFFVVSVGNLPSNRKSIGLARLGKLSVPCRIAGLRLAVERELPLCRKRSAS